MIYTEKDGELPPKQPCIKTSTLQGFVSMTQFLVDSQCMGALIGIAVGASGIGKSVGICSYQREELRREEVSSRSIAITVHPRPTPHTLMSRLTVALERKTRARQHWMELTTSMIPVSISCAPSLRQANNEKSTSERTETTDCKGGMA